MVIAPPDLNPDHLAAIVEDAEIEAIVCGEPERFWRDRPASRSDLGHDRAGQGRVAHARHAMGAADLRHAGAPEDGSRHSLAALTGAIDGPPHEGKVVLVDLLRHPALRRLADVPARSARAHRFRADRCRRAARRPPASARDRRRHRDLGHPVALASRADEPSARDRSRRTTCACPARSATRSCSTGCAPRSPASRSSMAYASTEAGRRLHSRRRARGFSLPLSSIAMARSR